MGTYRFDDSAIDWYPLGDLEHILVSILDIDRERHIADLLIKLEPHKPIVLHRHKALNKMFVIHGEHRLFEANGDVKEFRPAGRYTSSPADEVPHRECGGDDGAIVFFSIRGDGLLYEILDDEQNVQATLTMQDLCDLYDARLAAV